MLTTLTAGVVQLDLAPGLGGAIARLDVGGRPLLRPWAGDPDDLFSMGCNILVPFSNRISGGGFDWNGTHYSLAPNFKGDPFPIHGDGFQREWGIDLYGPVPRMTLYSGTFGPWRYCATQDFYLSETSLKIVLNVTNTGVAALPFGCGFHPWFPRTPETRLGFCAKGVWMENDHHLPTDHLLLSDAPDWDFARTRSLPGTLINNGYTDWQGPAHIDQGGAAVSCTVTASPMLTTAILYSPDDQADFFCFEPVSHPVDAFHLPSRPGLVGLPSGRCMRVSMTVSWRSP